MYSAQPQSFFEIAGAFLTIVAVAFAALSFAAALRSFAARLSAISLVAALSLFSNHWATYFAAIFIIATAVTELEFLQTLAAIIRGDKNYFEFRREFLTRDEALQRAGHIEESESIAAEDEEASVKDSRAPKTAIRSDRVAIEAFGVEQRALDWFENEFELSVQRYLRFWNDGHSVEVDGFIQGRRGERDTLVEVKWVRNEPAGTGVFSRIAVQASELVLRYREITKREAELILILVVPHKLSQAMMMQLTSRIDDRGIRSKIVSVPYDELKSRTVNKSGSKNW